MLKFIKRLFIFIGLIIGLVLIVALFIPTEFDVKRELVISQPKDTVFNYIAQLKNQENYGVWWKADPKIKISYSGTDGQPGFITKWKSKKEEVGSGQQKIISLTQGERIDLELKFIEPFESTNKSFMATQQIDGSSTLISWGISGEMPYPMNIMTLFINMEDQLGSDLDKGLKNLKNILEK